jgi:hypothetical protein
MTNSLHAINDARVQLALDELRALIRAHYPTAAFTVAQGDDPEGIYLTVEVDVVDIDEVVDVFVARLVDMQVDEGLPIYVVPVEPLAHVAQAHVQPERAQAYTATASAAS